MWENVSRGARKKKIGPKRLTSGVKDHGKDRVEWRARVRAHFKVPPRGCVEIGSHAPSSFETFMSIIHVGSQLMDSFQKVILPGINHATHDRIHSLEFWRRKKKTNNFPSGLSFSHRFKQLLAADDGDEDDLWCVASSASRNLDL